MENHAVSLSHLPLANKQETPRTPFTVVDPDPQPLE
jgi:hypothetical protein